MSRIQRQLEEEARKSRAPKIVEERNDSGLPVEETEVDWVNEWIESLGERWYEDE